MNLIRGKDTVKNSLKEEYDIPQNLDLLNKWTIPKIEPKTIYKLGTFEKLGLKQVVKTTEESISLDGDEVVIKLLNEKDIEPYRDEHRFIHIGLVQIAFKPLTLEGLPDSFIAVLRDGRNLNWKQSLMGIIQSSLAHGPVYFDVYPNLQLSLSDTNILDALTLNVKTHGYNYISGSEVICLCYRIYYKPLFTLNPHCKIKSKINETILIETNFSKSNITTRRPIKWEEIIFPENWTIERAIPLQPIIQKRLTDVIQSSEGTVQIAFENNKNYDNKSRYTRTNSSYSYISPIDNDIGQSSRASVSQIREPSRIEEIRIPKDNIVQGIYNTHDPEITESEMNFSI